jgi:hypothetical protein
MSNLANIRQALIEELQQLLTQHPYIGYVHSQDDQIYGLILTQDLRFNWIDAASNRTTNTITDLSLTELAQLVDTVSSENILSWSPEVSTNFLESWNIKL